MNIFLTGCTGFLGKSLLKGICSKINFSKDKYFVLCRDIKKVDLETAFYLKKINAKIIVGDLDQITFPQYNIDLIFHAAASTDRQAYKNSDQLLRESALSPERIIYLAKISKCKKIIFISSGAVYGSSNKEKIFNEETTISQFQWQDKSDIYGLSKVFQENYFTHNFSNTIVLRLFSFASVDFNKNHSAVYSFFKTSLENKKIFLKSDGSSKRSYLSSEGLSHYLISFMFDNNIPPGIYNVGGVDSISILDLSKKISRLLNSEIFHSSQENNKNIRTNYVPCMKKTHKYIKPFSENIDQILEKMHKGFLEEKFYCDSKSKKLIEEWIKEKITPKKYVIDVDGVICNLTPNNDYSVAQPLYENINGINKLYDQGHKIIIFTARGYESKIDWRVKTEAKFEEWGLKYHELIFGKPSSNFYIDDKLISPSFLSKNL